MPDQRRFELILAHYQGKPNALLECDGDAVKRLVAEGAMGPNDKLRPKGSGFFFFAHQANLFTEEELARHVLDESNLPPDKRGKFKPEQAPYFTLNSENIC